jgi:hypothetical protein
MPDLSFAETQALAKLAELFYSFLPASGAKYTWREVAHQHDLLKYWGGAGTQMGMSKQPAINHLFKQTFVFQRGKFCDLLITAVSGGIEYRGRKGEPITRAEIDSINAALLTLQFKIPELHDLTFLGGLVAGQARGPVEKPTHAASGSELEDLRRRFLELLAEQNPQKRGFTFERFLCDLFRAHGLFPSGSFRVLGEQIDGSIDWYADTILVEARWRQEPANTQDLYGLRGKCEKSEWTRGLFISIYGFADEVGRTFSAGKRANIITMDGQDLVLILEGHWALLDAIRYKMRSVGESSNVIAPLSKASQG